MSDDKHEKSDAYQKVRSAFDSLHIEERATFLVESVVAMMAEGVGQAGKVVSEVLEDLGDKLDKECAGEPAKPADEKAPKAKTKPKAKPKKAAGATKKKSGPKAGGRSGSKGAAK